MIRTALVVLLGIAMFVSMALVAGPEHTSVPPRASAATTRSPALTSLWRDEPADVNRVRIAPILGASEPSDLLLRDGGIFSVGDSNQTIYRFQVDNGVKAIIQAGIWTPDGLPKGADLEAFAALPGGEVLVASETNGIIFVMNPFPQHVCAAWHTGIEGTCLFGRANCGIEALAVLPGGRLFVGKEREPRGAFLFELPAEPCTATTLAGKIALKLPDEIGADLSAATFDEPTGHLLIVARTSQKVLEFELLAPNEGENAPRLNLVGSFSYAASEDLIGYRTTIFHQVEGIAVDQARVLYLVVDNNEKSSSLFGARRAALLRFFPVR